VIVRDNTSLRRALDERLPGKPLNDKQWLALINQGLVRRFWEGADKLGGTESALEWLVAVVQQLRSAWSEAQTAPSATRQKRRTPLDRLMEAQAAAIAAVISNEPLLAAFLARFLAGGVMDEAQAVAWLLEQAREQSESTWIEDIAKWTEANPDRWRSPQRMQFKFLGSSGATHGSSTLPVRTTLARCFARHTARSGTLRPQSGRTSPRTRSIRNLWPMPARGAFGKGTAPCRKGRRRCVFAGCFSLLRTLAPTAPGLR
jgi:hypothetical protein